jgi:hypothetical protein
VLCANRRTDSRLCEVSKRNVVVPVHVIKSYEGKSSSSARILKVRCNGDSLRAGKSSWQVDYRVSDRQQDGKVARF